MVNTHASQTAPNRLAVPPYSVSNLLRNFRDFVHSSSRTASSHTLRALPDGGRRA
jgi:hypothetical protein